MGNSGSHSSKSVQAQNVQHGGHSLPRDLRGAGGSSSAIGAGGAKQRNGGFKVLPERVPGQKLRMTDNGNVLHNGGTLSGRRLLGGEPDPPDVDFSKLAKRRSADMSPHHHHHHHHGSRSGSRSDYEDGGGHVTSSAHGSRGGAPPKRYHSDPDLLNSPGIISANPEGFRHYGGDPKKQTAGQQHKMRAPPPPQHSEPVNSAPTHPSGSHNQRKEGQSPTKDTNKRIFANFLKSGNKKSAPSPKQDLNNYRHADPAAHPGVGKGDYLAKNKHASLPTPQNNGAEVTSTKFDTKSKSTTYVLERRDHYGSNSVIGGGGGGGDSVGGAPSGGGGLSKMRTTATTESTAHNESFNQENRRFVKNGYSSSSDNRSLLLPSQHSSLQAKLSDSSLMNARSIDRSEIRSRALELQKRVRSMESLSCSDERDVNLNPVLSGSKNQLNERYNRQHAGTTAKDLNVSLENLRNPLHHQPPLNNGWMHGHLARKSSNSSSVLSDNRRGKSPNDKVPLRHRYSGDEPSSVDRSSRLSAPLSPRSPSSDNRHKEERINNSKIASESENFDAYFFGSSTKHELDAHHKKQTSDLYLGSLDKKAISDLKSYRHQRTPSDTEIGNGSSRLAHDSLLLNDRNGGDGLHNLDDIRGGLKKAPSNDNLRRGTDNHDLYDHNLQEHLSRTKTKNGAGLNDLLGGRESRKRDSFAGKKESHDKEHVDEHLQESFFLKAREPLNRIVEYSGKIAAPFDRSEASQNKTKMAAEGNGVGGDQSEDEMDINMQLRPTLPKRLQAMPRFSPTQVWRSFSHDELGSNENKLSDRCSSDGEEADVFEDRIQRVARPMAPPRGSNEKSADSGISPGAGSPLPLMYDFDAVMVPEKDSPLNSSQAHISSKKNGGSSHHYQHDPHHRPPPPISPESGAKEEAAVLDDHHHSRNSSRHHVLEPPIRASYAEEKKPAWTPEEDLASDFDAGSGDNHHSPGLQNPPAWSAMPIPEMISSQPKLISRKDMFNTRQNFMLLDSESRLMSMPIVMDSSDSLQPLSLSPDIPIETTKPGRKIKAAKNGEQQGSPQKYNSVRKLKRSLSGVLQGNTRLKSAAAEDSRVNTSLDENWSLSRSLPNSLHNGHDGDRNNPDAGGKYSKNRANKASDKNRHLQQQTQQQQRERLPRSESGPVFVMSRQASELAHHRQPFSDLEGRSFNDERTAQITSVTTTPGGATAVRYNRSGHIVYLPKYEAMQIVSENDNDVIFPERRAYSDLGMATNVEQTGGGGNGNINYTDNAGYNNETSWTTNTQNRHPYPFKKPKKFTYQSTVRQNERIKLEQKLSQEVAIKEHQRNREQELVKKVEEEFQKKRHKEKADIRQQLRILSLESNGQSDSKNYADNLNNSSSFDDDEDELNMSSLNVRPYHDVSPPDDRHDRTHLSLPPLLIPPEDYDLTVPRNTHHNVRMTTLGGGAGGHAANGGPSHPNSRRIAHSMYHNPEPIIMPSVGGGGHHPTQLTMIPPPAAGGSGFFSGIGKWMRRQQRLEKNDGGVTSQSSRLEPEGAPLSLGSRRTHAGYVASGNGHQSPQDNHHHQQQQQNGDSRSFTNPPSSPYQESRSQAIVGAKFSSGRNPESPAFLQPTNKTSGAPPAANQQRKSIYTHLQEVTEKEDRLRKHNQHPVEGIGIEGRTSSVWISPDKSYVKLPPPLSAAKIGGGGGFGGGHDSDRNGADFYEMPYDSIVPGVANGGRNAKYESQQYGREKDNATRPYQNNSLQRDWTAGQRHSIAIDTSRGQWGSSGNPAQDSHRHMDAGRYGRGHDSSLSSNSRSNGYSSGDVSGRRREVGRQDSYREQQEGNSLDYRQNYSEDKGLGAHHRSLSYSQLPEWDGAPGNRKNEAISPRSPILRVQPFNPNQVYRPVAFPTARQPESGNYN